MNKNKLSVTLAVRNEAKNIGACLESIKDISNEIIIFDEESTDNTREIAKKYGAKVFTSKHEANFHITKQKANERAVGDWILQLDADEVVSPELRGEIKKVIQMSNAEIRKYILVQEKKYPKKAKLFNRHQEAIEARDNIRRLRNETVDAFYLPRRNIFLGAPLTRAGVYPDGVIRLFRKGKAYLPAKSVHEQMTVEGDVLWLYHDLLHYDSPTFERYLSRANRYTDLTAEEFKMKKEPLTLSRLLFYSCIKPTTFFLRLYVRNLGFLDGMRGFIWSLFSALHFPIAYFKYWILMKSKR